MITILFVIACVVIVLEVVGIVPFFVFLFTRGAPFVPSKKSAIGDMIELSKPIAGERSIDIGSGAGSVVMAFARAGCEAHGVELNPVLVWWSRWRIRAHGLHGKAFIHQANLWSFQYSTFQVVTLYGFPSMMAPLERKLNHELPAGARVISNVFRFPSWNIVKKVGDVYLYCRS